MGRELTVGLERHNTVGKPKCVNYYQTFQDHQEPKIRQQNLKPKVL